MYILWLINSIQVNETYVSLKQKQIASMKRRFQVESEKKYLHMKLSYQPNLNHKEINS